MKSRLAAARAAHTSVKLLNLALAAWLVFGAQAAAAQTRRRVPARARAAAPAPLTAAEREAAERRRESFEAVWSAVRDHHFDPDFGGVDWNRVKAEFAPRVARTRTDRELHLLLREMLNRLGQSHFDIILPETIATFEAEGAAGEDEAAGVGGHKEKEEEEPPRPRTEGELIAEQMMHGVGLDLRIISRAAVVTRVDAGGPAERAGLKPGHVLRSVDGWPVRTLLAWLREEALTQPGLKHMLAASLVLNYLNGPPGSEVCLYYADARGVVRHADVVRGRLRGEMSPGFHAFPPQFVEFESRRLRGGVGYIRFSLFEPSVVGKFCDALREMADAPGVVVDLRGNRGGFLGVVYGMAGLLGLHSPLLGRDSPSIGSMRTRAGTEDIRVFPQKNAYRGRVVFLIDGGSQSASEMLASGLQEIGRATVVGERSAGATLPSTARELPTGAILQYAIADFITPLGRTLEGHGVEPDVRVALDRRSLLAGRDPQLEAATEVALGRGPAKPTLSEIVNVDGGPYANAGRVGDPAPPPAPAAAVADAGGGEAEAKLTEAERRAAEIVERFVEASGGRAALEKLSTRVSKGTFTGTQMGVAITGTVEIVEAAPARSVTRIDVPGLGEIRQGFTGEYGYEQVPMIGFRRYEGAETEAVRRAADFHWRTNLRTLYPKMSLRGTEKVGDAEAHVVEAWAEGRHSPSLLFFDVKTGLLVRRDSSRFEDYREVDGVRLPFTLRDGDVMVRLNEIAHNVSIDDARFAERKDCFTR
jgi:carboxyl-terminal processing protease